MNILSLFVFPSAGFQDSPYSGLYKIRFVKSKFNDGVFTQELNLFRDRGQLPAEIQNVRQDPYLSMIGSAPTPDPNSNAYYPASDENKKAVISANPSGVVVQSTPGSANSSSAVAVADGVVVTPVPDLGSVEVTVIKQSDLAPRSEAAPSGPFNKTGPLGNKLPWTQELEDSLNDTQKKE